MSDNLWQLDQHIDNGGAGTYDWGHGGSPPSRRRLPVGDDTRETMMVYFTLVTREDDGLWYPQFGDFDRSVVVTEKADSYAREYRASDMRIVTCEDETMQSLYSAMFREGLNYKEIAK